MTEVTARIEPAPVFDLDLEQLGAIIRRLPALSARAGHDSIKATLGYVADTTPEGDFVRDLFTLSTRRMIDKWYGSEANAGRYMAAVAGEMLSGHRRTLKT